MSAILIRGGVEGPASSGHLPSFNAIIYNSCIVPRVDTIPNRQDLVGLLPPCSHHVRLLEWILVLHAPPPPHNNFFQPLTDHRFYLHSHHEIKNAQLLNLQYVQFLRRRFFFQQLTCCTNSSRFLLSTNVVTLKSIFMSRLYHGVEHPGAVPSDKI